MEWMGMWCFWESRFNRTASWDQELWVTMTSTPS